MKKLEPDALIAVCGCLSQLDAQAVEALEADLVGGSGDRSRFAFEIESTIAASRETKSVYIDNPFERVDFEQLPGGRGFGRTRAFLKIQDGCENFCAYCVIPFARGKVRSLPIEHAGAQAKELAEQGFLEIVITGIEISSYGKDLPDNPPLISIIREISGAAPHVRLRLGSLDPGALTSEFCRDLSGISNMCNHFHLSLQSGCDETLNRMGRKYDIKAVRNSINSLRQLFPDCGISADLIVGFPGETEAEFEQTLNFINSVSFSKMHVFPFSPRPGTRAVDMPNQVKKEIRRERAYIIGRAAEAMELDFIKRQVGKCVSVLIEQKRGDYWVGHAGNYIEVALKHGGEKNNVYSVQITGISAGMTKGEIMYS